MANFSTPEALHTLCKSIPEWNTRLDELNGQIALRQIELARLQEHERPPTRSLKNKGSTESLRPKDGHENPFLSEDTDDIQLNPFDTPKSDRNGDGFASPRRRTPPPPRTSNTPPTSQSSPNARSTPALTRQPSQPTPPAQSRPSPAILRKRKTESLASEESHAPKFRTRSMIIVYYDDQVQLAFEDLVKFISGSRNAMRKGKMAAKMAKMKRAAELEVGESGDEDDEVDPIPLTPYKSLAVNPNGIAPNSPKELSSGIIAAADDSESDEIPIPKLKFVSTRQMGPSRDARPAVKMEHMRAGDIFCSYRRSGADGAPDIFDELDKGLEWSQGQCEHAAHQFLRDGDCSTEIANIKRKLLEVKENAEKETEKLKQEENSVKPPARSSKKPKETPRRQEARSPKLRRELAPAPTLEVDDMEVDDEEEGEDAEPMELNFKRSRDVGF